VISHNPFPRGAFALQCCDSLDQSLFVDGNVHADGMPCRKIQPQHGINLRVSLLKLPARKLQPCHWFKFIVGLHYVFIWMVSSFVCMCGGGGEI